MPTQRKAQTDKDTVKTSLRLPRRLWRLAHMRALDEGTQLQVVVTQAVSAYLTEEVPNEQ